MQKTQPQLLKGFRDFLPKEKRARDFVMFKIIEIFERFGFEPIETPTIEYKETLMGKYGDEADKLVYSFQDRGKRDVALRYDQTVPTARVIANYKDILAFPFRRYQTQNVFRADKPQKGRYREFTQCDIDIFGSKDPIADAEILACTYYAYKNIGFSNITLLVNDRNTLISTLEPFATSLVSVFSIIQSLDKLDKMSREDVQSEIEVKGLGRDKAIECMSAIEQASPSQNLKEILLLAEKLGVPRENLEFSSTTARGLDYYTGMIFEVYIPGSESGSVGGGGRYDKLINDLCGVDISAVGIAFGFDRTVEAAQKFGLIPDDIHRQQVLVTIFNDSQKTTSIDLTRRLRDQGIFAELYMSTDKLAKQFKYADKKGIQHVLVIGPTEVENNQIMYSNLQNGQRNILMNFEEVVRVISNSV